MSDAHAEQLAALEAWADRVRPEHLREVDTSALRRLAELADRRASIETEITAAVREARAAGGSWSMIGFMLGVSKQAAQQRYGSKASA